jgi:hypothetical protein
MHLQRDTDATGLLRPVLWTELTIRLSDVGASEEGVRPRSWNFAASKLDWFVLLRVTPAWSHRILVRFFPRRRDCVRLAGGRF